MSTIQEIMMDPIFEGFRIVAGKRGLYNEVSGTGIFDWEEPQDIAASFKRGEFVVTTLSEAKNRPEDLVRRIKKLIEIHASAICIKTVFFKTMPQDILDLANVTNTPIILFEDTYIDDIIFAIRNALSGNRQQNEIGEQLEVLLWKEDPSPEEAEKVFRKISPFLFEHFICIYATPKHQNDQRSTDFFEEEDKKINTYIRSARVDVEQEFHATICLSGALAIICSAKANYDENRFMAAMSKLIDSTGIGNNMILGISNSYDKPGDFVTALKESMYSNISAILGKETRLIYDELGIDALLIPVSNHIWISRFCKANIGKLKEYDEKHNAKLLITMLTYAESEGSVALTAMKLLQHENTIRYRLDRIREILNIAEQGDTYVHMFILARLYRIMQNLIH